MPRCPFCHHRTARPRRVPELGGRAYACGHCGRLYRLTSSTPLSLQVISIALAITLLTVAITTQWRLPAFILLLLLQCAHLIFILTHPPILTPIDQPPRCPNCTYPRANLPPTSPCPECGTPPQTTD